MSVRRKAGDIVWLKPGSGFVGQSNLQRYVLLPEEDEGTPRYQDWCLFECGDNKCREWANVKAEDGSHELPHVSECEMLDEQAFSRK